MASGAEPSSAAGGNSQDSILSAKVSRALEVRTDTPAMKAALDALAHLPDHQDDLFSVDSRSVRVAIEQDALQQALLLQGELKTLLDTVSSLRQGVTETASIAQRVSDSIHMNVVSGSSVGSGAKKAVESTSDGNNNPDPSSSTPTLEELAPKDDALEEEQNLAAHLSESFLQVNLAKKRVDAVHAFLEKFDLSESDSRLLDHYAFEDVDSSSVNGMAFLAALERVRLIRKELGRTFGTMEMLNQDKGLLEGGASGSSRDPSSRLGASSALRMMETLAQKQERAYERLYHWLQKYLQVHAHESAPGGAPSQDDDRLDEALSHPFVRKSLQTLKYVPAFYSHLLELISASRRAEETRRFLLALTSGYGGFPPIEMRAHDSVVYVGDMLAFCFRAFSVEADVARGLLSDLAEEDGEEAKNNDEEKDDVALAEESSEYLTEKPLSASEMLSHSMSGVARPLKSRILQVIANLSRRQQDEDDQTDDGFDDGLEDEASMARSKVSQLYEICGLLLFYASALEKSVQKIEKDHGHSVSGQPEGEDDSDVQREKNPIIVSMLECLHESSSAYEASLRVYGAMLDSLHMLTGDSESSMVLTMINQIVEIREASPGFSEDVECPTDYKQSLSLVWACETLVEACLANCKSLDDAVNLKQAIVAARKGGMAEQSASNLDEKILEKEKSLIHLLVEKETASVLDLCGLGAIVGAWKSFEGVRVEGMYMASHPGLTPEEAEGSLKEFYQSLYSPPIPSFESSINDPSLRKLARRKIAENVCSTYGSLYDAMQQSELGGYDDLSFLGHTPEQVKTLFSV